MNCALLRLFNPCDDNHVSSSLSPLLVRGWSRRLTRIVGGSPAYITATSFLPPGPSTAEQLARHSTENIAKALFGQHWKGTDWTTPGTVLTTSERVAGPLGKAALTRMLSLCENGIILTTDFSGRQGAEHVMKNMVEFEHFGLAKGWLVNWRASEPQSLPLTLMCIGNNPLMPMHAFR